MHQQIILNCQYFFQSSNNLFSSVKKLFLSANLLLLSANKTICISKLAFRVSKFAFSISKYFIVISIFTYSSVIWLMLQLFCKRSCFLLKSIPLFLHTSFNIIIWQPKQCVTCSELGHLHIRHL